VTYIFNLTENHSPIFQIAPGDGEEGEEENAPIEPVVEGEEGEGETKGNKSNLPLEDPIEAIDENDVAYFLVPDNIRPVMEMHTIEVCLAHLATIF